MVNSQPTIDALFSDAVDLLKQLITTPSFSKEEDKTATIMEQFFQSKNIPAQRFLNNVWAINKYFNPLKPSLLLNSHHDTVKPNGKYTRNPFEPTEGNGKLYGLGSTDAGGCLVALAAAFRYFYEWENLPFNIVMAAVAEEEISGKNGIEALLKNENFLCSSGLAKGGWGAIVGEPTQMQLAVAEKGLLVLDAVAQGVAGHAARSDGENALYKAIEDIEWFKNFKYPKISEWLGEVKQTVTVMETDNKAHNIIPSACRFVVDIRIPDCYTHQEILDIIRQNVKSNCKERSVRLRATRMELEHPLVQRGIALGKKPYGSPTCSDKALIPFPALKCGPGDGARSHTADEFIFPDEIQDGIETYIKIIEGIKF